MRRKLEFQRLHKSVLKQNKEPKNILQISLKRIDGRMVIQNTIMQNCFQLCHSHVINYENKT